MKATQKRLIGAARALFIERGILEVSVAEITQKANVNIALVSYHFDGREGLMVALAKDDARLALADLDKLISSNASPSEKIRRHVTGIIYAYHKLPYLNRLLQKLLREGSHETAEEVGKFFMTPVASARRQIIEAGIASGEFRTVSPELISFVIDGACAQIFTSPESRAAVLGDGEMTDKLLKQYADSTAELIVSGLRNASGKHAN